MTETITQSKVRKKHCGWIAFGARKEAKERTFRAFLDEGRAEELPGGEAPRVSTSSRKPNSSVRDK